MEKIAVATSATPQHRTVSVLKEFTRKKSTIGFLLLLLSILLFVGTFLFTDATYDKDDDLEEIFVEEKTPEVESKPSGHRVITEQKSKVSLKKKVFLALMTYKNSTNDIASVLQNWIPKLSNNENLDGVHFVSEIPISVDPVPSVLIKTMFVRTEEEKYYLKFIASLEAYTNSSRALWYNLVDVNTNINLTFLPTLVQALHQHDPMKERIYFRVCTKTNSCLIILSRAATKVLLEKKDNPNEFSSFLESHYSMNVNLTSPEAMKAITSQVI